MTLNHVRHGSGEPLVLVHGLGSELAIWDETLDALAAEHEVIALDLPGFGASAPLENGDLPAVERTADAVETFFGELGLERPHLAGHSTGGGVALELAKRGAIRSVLALAPVGFGNKAEYEWMRLLLRLDRVGARLPGLSRILAGVPPVRIVAYSHMFARPWRISNETARRMVAAYANAPGFDEVLDALRRYRFVPDPMPDVPVTIAWGRRDALLPPWQARRAARLLPGARVTMLPGCGHAAQWDDPAAVARAILATTARGRSGGRAEHVASQADSGVETR